MSFRGNFSLTLEVSPENQDQLLLQQLKLYETLLGGSSERARSMLSHQSFLRPLLDLLNHFEKATPGSHHPRDDGPPVVLNGGSRSKPHRSKTPSTSSSSSSVPEVLSSEETETHLMLLLNQLCSRLMDRDNVRLLDVFFNASSSLSSSRFPIFSILVNFLHSGGPMGQHARDALLLCMTLSKRHDKIGVHIAGGTNFCPVRPRFVVPDPDFRRFPVY